METIHGKTAVKPFPGIDLSPYVSGGRQGDIMAEDGSVRNGVFFMTHDTITALCDAPDQTTQEKYNLFTTNLQTAIDAGHGLVPGSVRQPTQVHAVCTGDWKLVRYVDPDGVEADQWELYSLTADPIERINLVDYRSGEVREDVSVPGLTLAEIQSKRDQLRLELARHEAAASGVYKNPTMPAEFQLLQNHPNPFNPGTSIEYRLARSMSIRLEIFNELGQSVCTLVDARKSAGTHAVQWHGTNSRGDMVPSGVYFCRLTGDGVQQTRKLTLLK